MSTASILNEVALERLSQSAKGYTPEHDDEHVAGELARAAAAYAKAAARKLRGCAPIDGVPGEWPWEAGSWKPRGPRENLIRAAAMIVAQLEQIDRNLSSSDRTHCIACADPLEEGDAYYPDVSGGVLHARCCGPERESYVKDVGTGEPLGSADPIPMPSIWSEEG